MAEVTERESPQSAASWITVTILTVFVMIVAHVLRNIPIGWVWGVNGWPLHLIYIIIISEALGKVSPKLRLNATQLLCLVLCTMFSYAGVYGWAMPGEKAWTDFMPHYSAVWFVGVPADEYLRGIYIDQVGLPEWFMTRDYATAEALAFQTGAAINWGSLFGPIITSSALIASTLLLYAFITWVFVGPQWIEKERLAYPGTWSYSYLVNSATTEDGTGKTKLFNWQDSETKVFWAAIVFGIIISIPIYVSFILPEMTAAWLPMWGAGEFEVPWVDIIGVPPLIPGMQWNGFIWMQQMIVWLAVPFEFLMNMAAAHIVLQIIYPHLLTVVTGTVPYSPGIEGWVNDLAFDPANPFPWVTFFMWGVPIGLFFWFIWAGRDRIKTVVGSLTGEDAKEHGMSLRLKVLGLIVCIVVYLAIWLGIGVPVFPAIMFMLVYIIWGLTHARITGIAHTVNAFECWVGVGTQGAFWAGPATGAWGWSFPQINRSTVAYSVMNEMHIDCWGWNNGSGGIGNLSAFYRAAFDTKANVSDILKYLVIFAVVSVPVYIVWDLYIMSHLGMLNMGTYQGIFEVPPYTPDQALDFGARALDWELGTPEKTYGWALAGGAFTFICMYLRSMFPWFVFNPIAWGIISSSSTYWWMNLLIVIPVKYVLFKVLGPARTARYIKPIIAGAVAGSMLPQILFAIYIFGTAGMANLANWR